MTSLKIAILGMVLLYASNGVGASEELVETGAIESKTCINTRLVRNFDAITDKHLFVEERSKKYYLITLQSRCFNLQSAHAIAFADSMSITCSKGFGEIIYRDSLSGQLESSRIDTIEPVESKEDAKAIVAARAAVKEDDG